MKIVVIGGTGLIGSKLVNKLREHGHEADHPRSFLFPAAVKDWSSVFSVSRRCLDMPLTRGVCDSCLR